MITNSGEEKDNYSITTVTYGRLITYYQFTESELNDMFSNGFWGELFISTTFLFWGGFISSLITLASIDVDILGAQTFYNLMIMRNIFFIIGIIFSIIGGCLIRKKICKFQDIKRSSIGNAISTT